MTITSTPSTSHPQHLNLSYATQDPYKFYWPEDKTVDGMDSGLTSSLDDSSLFLDSSLEEFQFSLMDPMTHHSPHPQPPVSSTEKT